MCLLRFQVKCAGLKFEGRKRDSKAERCRAIKKIGVTGCCSPVFRAQKPAADPTQKVHEYYAVAEALQRHLVEEAEDHSERCHWCKAGGVNVSFLGWSCSTLFIIWFDVGWDACQLTSNPLRDK